MSKHLLSVAFKDGDNITKLQVEDLSITPNFVAYSLLGSRHFWNIDTVESLVVKDEATS
jgi:hypothetical protein